MSRLRESKFRGNTLSKLSPSSCPSLFQIITDKRKSEPKKILSHLAQLSKQSSPCFKSLDILAREAANNAAYFYPPEVLQTLELFGKISFSSLDLFSLLTSRKSDLLNEPSPRRLVVLLRAMGALNLPMFHRAIWPELRAELCRSLSQFRLGIPGIVNALARQDCTDTDLIDALLVQALIVNENVPQTFFEASKLGVGKERLETFLANKNITSVNTHAVYLLAACTALKVPCEELHRLVSVHIQKSDNDVFATAKIMGLISHVGLGPQFQTEISNFIESGMKNNDFSRKFLPSLLPTIVDSNFVNLVLAAQFTHADGMSAEKLLACTRASGGEEKWLEKLGPLAKQLTVREARILWEFDPRTKVHALPPLMRELEANTVCRTVGPYTLGALNGNAGYELVLPRHVIFQLGSTETVRPEIVRRKSALNQHDVTVEINPLRQIR